MTEQEQIFISLLIGILLYVYVLGLRGRWEKKKSNLDITNLHRAGIRLVKRYKADAHCN